LLSLGKSLLQRRQGIINILTLRIGNTNTHMTESDILSSNLLVQTSCEDNAALQQTGEDIWGSQTLRQVHGSHTVSLGIRVRGELLETELGDSSLNLIRGLGVNGETLGHGTRGDLAEGGVQSVNELGGWGSEVAGLVVFVVLHDGQPLLDGGVVRGGGGLARLSGLESTTGDHDDAQTGWATDGLLGGSHDGIEIPLVEGNLLGTDTADTVDDDEGIGADAAGDLGDTLDVVQDTGGSIDVGDCDDLIGLGLEGLLDFVEGGAVANGGAEVVDVSAIGLQAGTEGVTEVAGVQDESILTTLDQVGGDEVPSEGTATGDNEGLGGGVGGLEQLASQSDGLTKDLDEAGSDVALTVIN